MLIYSELTPTEEAQVQNLVEEGGSVLEGTLGLYVFQQTAKLLISESSLQAANKLVNERHVFEERSEPWNEASGLLW